MEQLIYAPLVFFGVYLFCSFFDRKPKDQTIQSGQVIPTVDAAALSEIHYRMAAAPENAKKNLDPKAVETACAVFKLCAGRDPKKADISKISTIYPLVLKPKKKPIKRQLDYRPAYNEYQR